MNLEAFNLEGFSLETLGLDTNTLLIWCGLGLVSGIIAKYILPGEDKGGLISTVLVGIAGAFTGGALGNYFDVTTQVGGISLMSLVTAVVGSLVILIALRVLRILI